MIDTTVIRNKIIDIAMRGYLVEQKKEEGSVEELFSNFEIKSKNIGVVESDDIPYQIPDTWKWCRFGQIVDFHLGKTPSRGVKAYWEGGIYPWVSISDIPCNGRVKTTKEKITQSANDECFTKDISKAGTLIMSFKLTIGKVAILDIDAFHNEAIISIFPKYDEDNIFRDYLFYILPMVAKNTNAHGAIKGNTLNKTSLSNMVVPVPPLYEQKRIVKKLSEIFEYINMIDSLKEEYLSDVIALKNKVIDAGIRGKLSEQFVEDENAEALFERIKEQKTRLTKEGKIKKQKKLRDIKGNEIPFDIPQNWKWVRIGDICLVNPKNEISDDTIVSFIPMACVKEGYRNEHTYEERLWGTIKKGFSHFKEGDVGVAKITPCFQNRKSVVFKNLINGYGAGTTELTVVRPIENMVCAEYLLWFFKSNYFINNGIESFTGVVGQQRIHKDYLKSCVFPLPPFEEQKRIVNVIESVMEMCDSI